MQRLDYEQIQKSEKTAEEFEKNQTNRTLLKRNLEDQYLEVEDPDNPSYSAGMAMQWLLSSFLSHIPLVAHTPILDDRFFTGRPNFNSELNEASCTHRFLTVGKKSKRWFQDDL
ncbi:hypothetical protein J6590_011131 [Homalodisca vitripennis]|nr:hypothetical protein J6590_011131 [Homalodisca vitripennis]